MTCIIVDDEPLAVKLLESFVKKTPDLQLLGAFTDSVEAVNAVKSQQPDLLFLDIQMPDLNGMELARMIPPATRVVFTTAFKEYAFESYEVSALDFLLKPIRYNKFLAAVDKARQWYGREGQQAGAPPVAPGQATNCQRDTRAGTDEAKTSIFVRVDGELQNVSIDSIVYVSGMKDYVMFYLEGESKPLVSHLTMKLVEAMLPADKFLRVHRSYIVAVDKIRKVDRNDCIYIGQEVIHVPESYQQAFRTFIETRSF